MHTTEAFAMVATIAILSATVLGLARAFFNRPSKRALQPAPMDPALQERLDRLENAIQAIAIETERVAEGQRFTTKLLSEGGKSPGAAVPVLPAANAGEPAFSRPARS